MKKVIVFLFLVLSFSACQDHNFDDDHSDVTVSEPNSLLRLSSNYNNFVPSLSGNLWQNPSSADLAKIIHFIINDEEYILHKDEFHQNYGEFAWNWSIIFYYDYDHYNVLVPIIKSDKITAILGVTGHEDHMDIEVETVVSLMQKMDELYIEEIESSGDLLYIFAINTYYVKNYRRINKTFNSFISKNIQFLEVTEFKNIIITANFAYASYDPDFTANYVSVTSTLACGGGGSSDNNTGGLGGLWNNGGSGEEDNGSCTGLEGGTGDVLIEEDEVIPSILDKLTIEERECINKHLTDNARDMLLDLNQTSIPCDDLEIEDIVSEVLAELCDEVENPDGGSLIEAGPGMTVEELENMAEENMIDADQLEAALDEALDGVDRIILPPNFDKDCPCFNNILETLKNGGQDNWLCKMIKTVDDSKNWVQGFTIYDPEHPPERVMSVTKATGNPTPFFNSRSGNSKGTIYIPDFYCDQSSDLGIEIASIFIHEMMHGYVNSLMADAFPGGLPNDFFIDDPNSNEEGVLVINIEKYWEEISGLYATTPQHSTFFKDFLDPIMEALWKLNGSNPNESIEDYAYFAHLIVSTNGLLYDSGGNLREGLPAWIYTLGIIKQDGTILFDLDYHKSNWENNVGDTNFNIDCEE